MLEIEDGQTIRNYRYRHNQLIQEMEERISATEDALEDLHSSTKENLKSNKSLTQNIQEI